MALETGFEAGRNRVIIDQIRQNRHQNCAEKRFSDFAAPRRATKKQFVQKRPRSDGALVQKHRRSGVFKRQFPFVERFIAPHDMRNIVDWRHPVAVLDEAAQRDCARRGCARDLRFYQGVFEVEPLAPRLPFSGEIPQRKKELEFEHEAVMGQFRFRLADFNPGSRNRFEKPVRETSLRKRQQSRNSHFAMPFVLAARAQNSDASQRFTRALELLGAADLTARLGGIYALEGLGREPEQAARWGAIIEVLAAFVRRRARWEIGFAPIETTPTDVLAALTALGRAPQEGFSADRPLDLHGIALREAILPFCRFERAFLYDCDFEGALLVGAKLRGAWLARANLTRANLDGADLRGADLTSARGLIAENLKGVLHDADTRWP